MNHLLCCGLSVSWAPRGLSPPSRCHHLCQEGWHCWAGVGEGKSPGLQQHTDWIQILAPFTIATGLYVPHLQRGIITLAFRLRMRIKILKFKKPDSVNRELSLIAGFHHYPKIELFCETFHKLKRRKAKQQLPFFIKAKIFGFL